MAKRLDPNDPENFLDLPDTAEELEAAALMAVPVAPVAPPPWRGRGKNFGPCPAAWGQVDANGKGVDPDEAADVLNQAAAAS